MTDDNLKIVSVIMPDWIKRLIKNKKKREYYHLKKYGNLKKIEEKERKFQNQLDDDSFNDELSNFE